VSLRVQHVNARLWRITADPHGATRDFVVHLPMDTASVASVSINGKPAPVAAEVRFTSAGKESEIEVRLR